MLAPTAYGLLTESAMPTLKLTKTNIDTKAVRSTAEKPNDILYWDVAPKGFGLRVTPTGKKVFIVQGRVKGSDAPAARFTIGEYGPFTVDQAREDAEEILRSLKKGIDPREVAEAEKALRERAKLQQVSLKDVAAAYMDDNTRRKLPLKKSSRDTIDRHIKTTFKDWQDKSIFTITREMVRDRYNEMLEGGLHGDREGGSPGQANQAFQILRAIFYYAMDTYRDTTTDEPLLKKNPVKDAIKKWQQLNSREDRRVAENKIGAVWNLLTTTRASAVKKMDRTRFDLVMVIALTGLRFEEAAAMTWERLNLDGPVETWHLPDPKSRRAVTLPLSSQTVAILKQRLNERDSESPFVFPSWGKSGHIKDPRATFDAVSKAAGQRIAAHDLRRTFLDVGNEYCDIDLLKVQLLMQHSIKKTVTTEHYMRISKLQKLAPAIQQIADWIEQAGLIAAGSNVVALPQRA
jgi:integrase